MHVMHPADPECNYTPEDLVLQHGPGSVDFLSD